MELHPATYSTFRAVWIRGAGVKPLRGGVAPTPPVPNSCENRCNAIERAAASHSTGSHINPSSG